MNVFRFIFQFLYIRDWHSGDLELSKPRLTLFASALLLIALAVLIVAILQTPVEYSRITQ